VSPSVQPADPAVISGLVKQLYAPVTTTFPVQIGDQVFPPGTYTVPQPTGSEVQRETVVARFVGRYYIGPPRFSNQSSTIRIYSNGIDTASNQFLHGRSQIVLFPPDDPTAQPTTNDPVAGQVTGLVSIFPQNSLQSSANIFMEVTNVPGLASNDPRTLDHGLPSHLAVTYDPVSGGPYAGPQFTSTPAVQTNAATGSPFVLLGASGGAVATQSGTGLLDIKYIPAKGSKPGTSSSGKAIVTVQALIHTTGVTNALAKQIN
jgi:hypothetical protein